MKKQILNSAVLLVFILMVNIFCLPKSYAQQFDTLNINNVSALFQAKGDLFWNYENQAFTQHYEVPKGGNRHTIFAASLWIGGFDQGEDLHLFANTYRQTGDDTWPGPLSIGDAKINQTTSDQWNKVWKVSRNEIEDHINGINTSDVIINWPAHGDTSLGQAFYLAPFVDSNGNGIYEPLEGDYPKIKGDMMLWWVFNDNLNEHTESFGLPLGVEVQGSAYAFKDSTDIPALFNTIFIEYKIINRSQNTYYDFYAGKWVDFDIGYAYDDFIGSIPEMNSFFGYNGNDIDSGDGGYGHNPPMQSVTFLDHDLSHFIAFNNSPNINGNPIVTTNYYNYLRAHWKDGTPMCWGGNGLDNCWISSQNADFMYPDDPRLARNNDENWSEVTATNIPGDRRGIGSVGPYTYKPGDELFLTFAYIFHRADSGGSTGAYDLMTMGVIAVQEFFDSELKDTSNYTFSSIPSFFRDQEIKVFPNPATDQLYLNISEGLILKAEIINTIGQTVFGIENISNDQTEIDISNLSEGIYILKVKTNNGLLTEKFIINH